MRLTWDYLYSGHETYATIGLRMCLLVFIMHYLADHDSFDGLVWERGFPYLNLIVWTAGWDFELDQVYLDPIDWTTGWAVTGLVLTLRAFP